MQACRGRGEGGERGREGRGGGRGEGEGGESGRNEEEGEGKGREGEREGEYLTYGSNIGKKAKLELHIVRLLFTYLDKSSLAGSEVASRVSPLSRSPCTPG